MEQPDGVVYLALHGTYGILWVLKSNIFGDKNWEKPTPLWYGLLIWVALTLYWTAPYIICSQGLQMPLWWLALCTSVYILGIFFHFVSDMQKHTSLALKPGLITTGLWSRLRNPNYFGELLIYLGFVAIPMHWLPLSALGAMIVGTGYRICSRRMPRSPGTPSGRSTRLEAGDSSPWYGESEAGLGSTRYGQRGAIRDGHRNRHRPGNHELVRGHYVGG